MIERTQKPLLLFAHLFAALVEKSLPLHTRQLYINICVCRGKLYPYVPFLMF